MDENNEVLNNNDIDNDKSMENIDFKNRTIKLNKPLIDITKLNKDNDVKNEDSEITKLVFQEIEVKDYINYDQSEFSRVKFVIHMTAKLTGYPLSTFNKMSGKDYLLCSLMLQYFFGTVPRELTE
ncbi:hypothetical protein [Silvanigrella sp.]|jgi:hypothetical protein|uniref:hypothetical protein n=1 Tax=Silvanigrella sp. TaxID=2024976 RepID=UPI0037C9C058